MSELVQYRYRNAISGFFEFPVENARKILPSHLEPAELHHGSGIFSVTCFDFCDSMVGEYGELVMAVIVAPLLKTGAPLPQAAYYPYLVATTTKAAREHAIQRWHLPHWMEDLDISLQPNGRTIVAKASAGSVPIASMTIGDYSWQAVSHLYQSHMKDRDGAYYASILMEGEQSEHEEETGNLVLSDHPFNAGLDLSEISTAPFREVWMRNGVQSFHPLASL